MHPSSDIGDRR